MSATVAHRLRKSDAASEVPPQLGGSARQRAGL